MKLINKLITKTAIYKHLNALYQQALKDMEVLQENARKDCNDIQELKKLLSKSDSELLELKEKYDYLKISNDSTREFVKELKQDITNKLKLIRKIRARVNKLDKKDENVKEIKSLIKEVM